MQTQRDHYPHQNIAHMTSFLQKEKVFSTFDLLKGYYQVGMKPEVIPKTAINPPPPPLLPPTKYRSHDTASLLKEFIPSLVASVQNSSKPSTVKAPQEFLGIINHYHRFLPAITATLGPLYASLKASQKTWHVVPFKKQPSAMEKMPNQLQLFSPILCHTHLSSSPPMPVTSLLG
ncbi:uncharacterized protein [Palaemon carinicauda]|uniref:uncharacterized protein n=1 Tax=Palaemon carinicauda TaxID=392227 RepID=UPI0035B5CE2F